MGSKARRLPIVLTVAVVAATAVLALTGAGRPGSALEFLQNGHWLFNADFAAAFHLNGSSRSVDARAAVPGAEPGSIVVQSPTSGYVVGSGRITEFGKSSLQVQAVTTPASTEVPFPLEVVGGPYLVYRQAGSITRLGDPHVVVPAGGPLGDPVVTADGTVWLQRTDSGSICKLARGADGLVCPVDAPRGHAGALTVVADRPVFVDAVTDTLHTVGDRLGEGVPMNADVPETVQLASVDVDGRIAALDPGEQRLHLVDASGLDDRRAGATKTVTLPPGDYSDLDSSGQAVVLIDKSRNVVHTYDGTGQAQRSTTMPPGGTRISRGEDSRVYVDNVDGKHVVVVDHEGTVAPVQVAGSRPTTTAGTPQPPATSSSPPGQNTTQRPVPPGPQTPVVRTTTPPRRTTTTTTTTARPGPGPTTTTTTTKPPPAVPASPPGVPPGVRATAGNGTITVNWGAAAANGAPVSAYHVTWTSSAGGDTKRLGGGVRSTVLTGLTNGVAYTVTVAAENSAGRGGAAQAGRVTPVAPTTKKITLTKGRATTDDGCEAPNCAMMKVTMSGFTPNTNVVVRSYSSDPGYTSRVHNEGISEDGTGYFEAFPFDTKGATVWVVADGVESGRVTW